MDFPNLVLDECILGLTRVTLSLISGSGFMFVRQMKSALLSSALTVVSTILLASSKPRWHF